jgi:hypothetical protein
MTIKMIVATLLALVLGAPFVLGAYAQETTTVSATVSALAVSLTMNPGSVNYGTLAFETSRKSTEPEAGNVTFTATNTGNASESFLVHGAAATGDAFSWALEAGALGCGPVSSRNKYRHSVKVVGASSAVFLQGTDDALASGVAATTGTVQFTTELYMPCAGSGGSGKVASTAITVVATSP